MISSALVDATWEETAGLSPAEARAQLDRLGTRQPALLAFVLAESAHLTPPAAELAVYLFFVITRMFYGGGAKVRRVSLASVRARSKEIEQRLAALQVSHEAFLVRAALVLSSLEPHVYSYLSESIVEAPSDDVDPVPLTPDDEGSLFLLLSVVINALDGATVQQASP